MTNADEVGLLARIAMLEKECARNAAAVAALQAQWQSETLHNTIFEKAYRVVGLWGDYLEFGTFRGQSFAAAFLAAKRVYEEMVSGAWDHAFKDKSDSHGVFDRAWAALRFIGFDSFEGIPGDVGSVKGPFKTGTYCCGEEEFLRNVANHGVDLAKVKTVKGSYRDSLTAETARALGLKRIAIVHIDSDLYESACQALDFVTPYLIDGAVIIFDEWYQYMGSPYQGERLAFREWCGRHPEWIASAFQKEGAFRHSFVVSRRKDDAAGPEPAALFS